MSEKMLVTQALDERDLLVKKINDKIEKASFIDTIKPNEDKVFEKRVKKALKNDCYSSREVCYNTMEDNYTKKETKQ